MERVGMYAGTFDPVTYGHLDIIRRAACLVDRLVVGVAISKEKSPLFSAAERVRMLQDAAKDVGLEIEVQKFDNLLMHFAEQVGATVLIRGLRAVSDFEYEFQMVGMNRAINQDIQTVFLMADADHQAIASKLVKEIARLGGDVSTFVPAAVLPKIRAKFATK